LPPAIGNWKTLRCATASPKNPSRNLSIGRRQGDIGGRGSVLVHRFFLQKSYFLTQIHCFWIYEKARHCEDVRNGVFWFSGYGRCL
jgi:hypothetical protein